MVRRMAAGSAKCSKESMETMASAYSWVVVEK
jgi:hypothetical protein